MHHLMHWHMSWGFPEELPLNEVRERFTRHQDGWSHPHTRKHFINRQSWSIEDHSCRHLSAERRFSTSVLWRTRELGFLHLFWMWNSRPFSRSLISIFHLYGQNSKLFVLLRRKTIFWIKFWVQRLFLKRTNTVYFSTREISTQYSAVSLSTPCFPNGPITIKQKKNINNIHQKEKGKLKHNFFGHFFMRFCSKIALLKDSKIYLYP